MSENPYLSAMEGVRRMLPANSNPLKSFNRKSYADAFKKYHTGNLATLEAIEGLYNTVADPETMLRNMAEAMLEEARKSVEESTKKTERENRMMNANLMLVTYVFPSVLEYKGNSSKAFADMINACWKEAFPKAELQVADYEFIEKGFHKRFCYITTAACQSSGMSDDCEALTKLRTFRDSYMAALPEGEALIRRYYDVAPTIVKHINAREDARQIYDGIWSDYLQPCLELIDQDRAEECCELYGKMVNDLKDQYFLM